MSRQNPIMFFKLGRKSRSYFGCKYRKIQVETRHCPPKDRVELPGRFAAATVWREIRQTNPRVTGHRYFQSDPAFE